MIKTDLPLGGSGGGGGTGTVTTTPAGGGTPGKLAKFTGATSIGDSIATESGATISIAGSLSLGSALTVPKGGTGLASGTSGGILGFTGATTLASSIALTANALVLGGGAGATPTPLGSLGTTTTVLHGNAAGAPTFSAVSLTADVSGDLPFSSLVQASGASILAGRGSAGGAGDFQEITLGTGLLMTGTVLSASANSNTIGITGSFDGGGSAIANNSITYVRIPYGCTITAWSIVVDTGTCTIDIFKIANSDGGALPTSSITAAATPSIASGNQHYSTTLTAWTTAITALDIIAFKVTAISGATKASITVICTKT